MSSLKDQTDISGFLGGSLAVRKVNGKVVIKNRPERKMGDPSVKQQAVQKKFLKAAKYAKTQMEDADLKALYETGITEKKKNAFAVAFSDSINAPEVSEIKTAEFTGAAGDIIKIIATDDFKVVRVKVVITGADANILEKGEAVQDKKNAELWRYFTTVANPSLGGTKISATAFDTPDNETTLEKVL
ncbi:hypothetical protein BH10BAC4_BH10BAC4_13260 [soil metagenome]